ncbi:hypothetical protein BDW02DRAFT_568948 [Decorospora gaudefroyi]|uniref:Uncharacterized protein n=1 Tax=Decorospora gaudefroyi TaxID=184978 RepID=A0A6A5KM48_9PLEO|nr:hypothetical protein BDW02DRAFT_568948 [Decorospora gaudefroyi]
MFGEGRDALETMSVLHMEDVTGPIILGRSGFGDLCLAVLLTPILRLIVVLILMFAEGLNISSCC